MRPMENGRIVAIEAIAILNKRSYTPLLDMCVRYFDCSDFTL